MVLCAQVLSAVQPPYSVAFAQWLLRHMVASGMRRKRETQQTHGSTELLRGFAQACQALLAASRGGGAAAPVGASGGAPGAGGARLSVSAREQAGLNEMAK